jgi:hypothetical protein
MHIQHPGQLLNRFAWLPYLPDAIAHFSKSREKSHTGENYLKVKTSPEVCIHLE